MLNWVIICCTSVEHRDCRVPSMEKSGGDGWMRAEQAYPSFDFGLGTPFHTVMGVSWSVTGW